VSFDCPLIPIAPFVRTQKFGSEMKHFNMQWGWWQKKIKILPGAVALPHHINEGKVK
jgi:hypothetical protein